MCTFIREGMAPGVDISQVFLCSILECILHGSLVSSLLSLYDSWS
jgi:hypothetical protein